MNLTKKEKELIVQLRNEGFTYRKIAEKVLGRESRESSIRGFLKTNAKENKISKTSHQHELFSFDEVILPKSNIRILLLDIETAPCAGFYFGNRYEIYISQEQVISESFILTYSAKYLGNPNIIFGGLTYEEVKNEDDSRIVAELYDLLDKVDIVIAHNGKQFDIKVINTRLLFNGFPQPKPYKVVDTLLIARRVFKFPSNKLDSICQFLGLDTKIETEGFKLWKGYLNGDEESMTRMMEYNIQDTIILEQVYLKLRAWDSTHPNMNIYRGDVEETDVCPVCGSMHYKEITDKQAHSNICSYDIFRCSNCSKIFKKRKNSSKKKINFVNSI